MAIQQRLRYSVTEALRIAKADSKSSVLILLDLSAAFDTVNHQILLSTLSSLASLGFHFAGLNPISPVVFQGGLGRGGIQSTSTGHWGSSGISSWTPPLLHIHYITGTHHTGTCFSYHCYADDTQLYLSFQPDDPTVAAWISGCLADISAWMKEHHLQLNLAKTELLVVPATPTLQHDFSIQLGTSIITPSTSVRNLGVIFDDQLTFKSTLQRLLDLAGLRYTTSEKSGPF